MLVLDGFHARNLWTSTVTWFIISHMPEIYQSKLFSEHKSDVKIFPVWAAVSRSCIAARRKTGKIYGLYDADENIFYVGQTLTSLRKRAKFHEATWHERDNSLTIHIRSLLANGFSVEMRLLEICEPDLVYQREIAHISLQRKLGAHLFNRTAGGDGGNVELWARWKKPVEREKMIAKRKGSRKRRRLN